MDMPAYRTSGEEELCGRSGGISSRVALAVTWDYSRRFRQASEVGTLSNCRSVYFEYPKRLREAEEWCLASSDEGRETYFCAHLLTKRRRIKEHAAPVLSLWADADGSCPLGHVPEPTAVVETSPGRHHLFWRLGRPLPPREAEVFNRRLSRAIWADPSGWDLGQLLRPPGTRNRKYRPAPSVRLLKLAGDHYHPRELDLALPSEEVQEVMSRSKRPTPLRSAPDLSRLSARMRRLVELGNRGEYRSRSEADFAVCIAMFGAGYSETDVWAVMTDPVNGIAGKYLGKGRHGNAYLSLTIGKAHTLEGSKRTG